MDITSPAPAVSTVLRHTLDLRPAADAAALARDPRPSLPLGPALVSQPPQAGQVAAISRALLDTSDTSSFPPLKAPERVLKPWGIQMLPYADGNGRRDETDPDRPEIDSADGGSTTTEPTDVRFGNDDAGSEAA